jgi:hypothetical protein
MNIAMRITKSSSFHYTHMHVPFGAVTGATDPAVLLASALLIKSLLHLDINPRAKVATSNSPIKTPISDKGRNYSRMKKSQGNEGTLLEIGSAASSPDK